MKTMSWSRYHALSWSFTRIGTRLRHGGGKRRRRAAGPVASATANTPVSRPHRGEPERRGREPGGGFLAGSAGGFLARVSQPLSQIFRTKWLRSDTDI
jgi:hypothetical protein